MKGAALWLYVVTAEPAPNVVVGARTQGESDPLNYARSDWTGGYRRRVADGEWLPY